MKVIKAFNKEVKGKKYYQYRINFPYEIARNLIGKTLKVTMEENKVIVEEGN